VGKEEIATPQRRRTGEKGKEKGGDLYVSREKEMTGSTRRIGGCG